MASSGSVYKLRCTLLGHSLDVRAVAVSSTGQIVTASRDQTAKLWEENMQTSRVYEERIVYKGHTGFVTSVCLIPPNEAYPNGLTITGSRDSNILVFPLYSSEPIHTLTGHSSTVSCLTWKQNILVSGSWDNNIRVWKNWECVQHLEGHSGPLWSVAIMETNSKDELLIISASADKTLKCWKGEKDVVTYKGHTDCVRDITLWSSDSFLSCSNDASIRLWKLTGECLTTFYGHTSFIYSISAMESCLGFVSGGEDRSLKVWDSIGNNFQTIHLPAQSVWAVAILPNSDIVAGTSDGLCRVFTKEIARQADAEELAQFEESLAKSKVAVEDIGGLKKSDLPDKSFLLTAGKRDGQTVMIRDGDKVLCYNWSAAKEQWEAVGEVVGGAGGSADTSGKVLYQGKEYDYVFDVDLDEGRTLKLPYNKGEDPWMSAQAFIHRHELPQDYLEQVANFITTSANVSAHSVSQSSGFVDPFTGGARYVPSGLNMTSAGMRGSDPFTGSGRYVPNSTASNHPAPVPSTQYFPQTVPLIFESINKAGIISKLQESNALVSDPLTEEQILQVVEAVASSSADASDLAPLEKALQWPSERVWPVLDVLRLALRSAAVQERWISTSKGEAIVGVLVEFLKPPSQMATQLLSLRCLANMASHPQGRCILASSRDAVLTSAISITPYPNKNMEIAAATLLINYSIIFKNAKAIEDQCQVLSAAATVALCVQDPEAQFRTLVAIGTLLTAGDDVRLLAESMDLKPIIEKYVLMVEAQKVCECARSILKIL